MILRRLFRTLIAMSLGRAWAQRSSTWLTLAGALFVFRSLDRLAARAGRRARSKSST
jgi:hypothetical protein